MSLPEEKESAMKEANAKKVASINFITIQVRDTNEVLQELHYSPKNILQACEMYFQLETENFSDLHMSMTIEEPYSTSDDNMPFVSFDIPPTYASMLSMILRSFATADIRQYNNALEAAMSEDTFYEKFSV